MFYTLDVMLFVGLVDSSTAGLLDSCEYAVGGYCEDESAYFASGVTEIVSDVCDMCGHPLPPCSDEHLRQKHIQVRCISCIITTTASPSLFCQSLIIII